MARGDPGANYVPQPYTGPRGDFQELVRWALEELQRAANVLQIIRDGHLEVSYVVPPKPRTGDIRYADGTKWNPGSGEGVYRYGSDNAWHYLG